MGFGDVALGAIAYMNEYKGHLARALLAPFIAYLFLETAKRYEPGLGMYSLIMIASVLVQTLFAITTHRIILLGPQSVPKWGILKWTWRETFFALYVIGLALIVTPICFLAFVPVIGWLLAMVAIFWLAGRLSLVFPAIAIDQGVTFRLSWKLTRNRQGLMFLVIAVSPVISLMFYALLNAIPFAGYLSMLLWALMTVFMVAVLSVSYRVIYQEAYQGGPGRPAEA